MNVSSDEHFYAGTKHMVTALTKALNAELRQKKTKIRITVCLIQKCLQLIEPCSKLLENFLREQFAFTDYPML